MKYVLDLSDDRAGEISVSGGKGANLHKLMSFGYNVPEGFVITTAAQRAFIESNNLNAVLNVELSQLQNDDNTATVTRVGRAIRKAIEDASFPAEVLNELEAALAACNDTNTFAVRSSGVFEDSDSSSWAGQFDSFLRVRRRQVPEYIQHCWASLFSARAISYNTEAYQSLQHLSFAVVVQQMLKSDVSGVAFSIEPGQNDSNRILIEATPGVGADLVAGKEMPFAATMDKRECGLLKRSVSDEQYSRLLLASQLAWLCEETRRIENHFDKPVDIEWSFEKGKLFVLQVRPITSLKKTTASAQRLSAYPDIRNYELTFKVSGLGFLFCDILISGFAYLSPLFTSKESDFRQYFTNEKMQYAAKEGYRWLSQPDGFIAYQSDFEIFNQSARSELNRIFGSKSLTPSSVDECFQIMAKFLNMYSRMDFQFTNLTYTYIDENPVIRTNLELLSQFKDVARLWINEIAIDSDSAFVKCVAKLSEQFGIETRTVELYKTSEIASLFHGSFVPEEVLRDREKSYTIYIQAGQRVYLTGDESLTFIGQVSEAESKMDRSALVGQVANKGDDIVSGTVRIINVNYADLAAMEQQINEMKEGEILVAEFTAPELMLACRKARAIVTDLGGMLSHAAIVSRELGIPCLVGTQSATKALATGDRITIDFNHGTINRYL